MLNPDVEPLSVIVQFSPPVKFLALTTKQRSVNVLGIEENEMLEAPPEPTVLEAISSNVLGIMPP
jgi:hypothetical protein